MGRIVRQLMDEQVVGVVGRDDELAVLRQTAGRQVRSSCSFTGWPGSARPRWSRRSGSRPGPTGHGASPGLPLDRPTERGFLDALGERTGGGSCRPATLQSRLGELGERVVLMVDTYELFRILDPWLRLEFVPALGDNVRIVLSGRESPMTGWPSAWAHCSAACRSRTCGAATLRVCSSARAWPATSRAYLPVARGHPLSLRLAASALTGRPGASLDAVTVKAVVEGLTELYLGVLDPATRRALDAASVVRRSTLSLLAAMLPDAAPQDAFDRLWALPFVELGDDGLVLHDTVREAVAAQLLSSDPDRSRRYRAAAWRQLRRRSPRASTPRSGGTRPTCSTSSRTRPSARRSSRRPSTCSRSRSRGRRIDPRSLISSAPRAGRVARGPRHLVAAGTRHIPRRARPGRGCRRLQHVLRDGQREPSAGAGGSGRCAGTGTTCAAIRSRGAHESCSAGR